MNAARRFFTLRSSAEALAAQTPDLKALAGRTAYQIMQGHHPQRKAGPGENFWQFRDYQTGDMPGEIDWRQSAKTDRVFIRQKEIHKAQSVLFWLKHGPDMDFQSSKGALSKSQAAATIALTLALLHNRGGEMIAYAGAMRPGHSEKTLQNFERLLLAPSSEDEMLGADLALSKIPRHAELYLISDFLEEPDALRAACDQASARTANGWMIQVLDPAEIDLPYQGRIVFEDHHGPNRALINNAVDVRDEYKTRIKRHIEAVEKLCSDLGWHYLLYRTDQDLTAFMIEFWTQSQIRKNAR